MRIKKAGVALLAASALALSACSGPAATDGKSDKAAALPASDINRVEPAKLKEGGNLRLAFEALPTNYNPIHVNGNTVDNSDLWAYMSPQNIKFAEDGTWEPNKTFLESYKVDNKADGDVKMTVTLTLNPEAKWYDGTPISAADYQANWNACKTPDTGFDCASQDGWK